MSYLEIKDISFNFDKFQAIKNINLSIQRGELFTLLGPSGSGKSTLLHCIAGFLYSKNGSILLDGEDISMFAPNERKIGMVFQSYALFPHLSVFNNIAYPLKIRNWSKIKINKRVEDLLKIIEMAGKENNMPHELSGGQQQRVALARAISFNPNMVLMDEPLGALDKKLRQQMQFEIRSIQKKIDSTILYVTHDQTEALTISDRIGIINNGLIVQVGTPQFIYENPATTFVADFLGNANFIYVKVIAVNNNTCELEYDNIKIKDVPKPEWLNDIGLNVTLFFRPEHCFIKEGPSLNDGELPCKIIERYFQGEVLEYKCILKNGEKISVHQRNELSINDYEDVHLCITSKKLRLFNENNFNKN